MGHKEQAVRLAPAGSGHAERLCEHGALKRWHPAATMTAPTHHILARATNAISWKEAAWGFSLST